MRTDGMVHTVVKTSLVPEDGPVMKEQINRLTSRMAFQAELPEVRRVEYRGPETDKVYAFLTNHRRWAAQTVVDISKSRCEVEPFFKWIKQNQKIRSFLGHSMNAVASLIFVALCAYLVEPFQHFISRSAMGIQAVLRLAQLSVSQHKTLTDLTRGPKQDPPDLQMPLRLRAATVRTAVIPAFPPRACRSSADRNHRS